MKKIGLFLAAAGLLTLLLTACDTSCRHWGMREIPYDPTCSQEGYVLHVCDECGHTYKSDIVEPYGHVMSHETVAPTCEEQGYTVYTCAQCDYHFEADHVTPDGHQWETTVVAPLCDSQGHTEYVCRVCELTYRAEYLAPRGHDMKRSVTAPTCTEQGYITVSCACGYSYRTAYQKPNGHTFHEETVRPNYEQTGHTVYTCACGYRYVGNYVWYSDIFTGAAGEGSGILAYGVDLSHHNKSVDWNKLKTSDVGFVILRIGTSKTDDTKFEEYYAAAKAAGIPVGCYFYTYATTTQEALADAERVLAKIRGKTFEYPVYYDMEDPSLLWQDRDTLTDVCLTFSKKLIDAGFFPGLYTNRNWLGNYLNAEKITTLCDVWYAQWRTAGLPDVDYSDTYGMWQYSDAGKVEGIEGVVDVNVAYKDYPKIIKENHYNGY